MKKEQIRSNLSSLFTEFNDDMTTLLYSSSAVQSYVLDVCDFSSSRPLLQKIRDVYHDNNKTIPQTLFEAV